jgi:DNA-binding MarR family transcriptional regulator
MKRRKKMEKPLEKFTQLSNEVYTLCSRKHMMQRQCIGLGRMECQLLTHLNNLEEPVCMNDLAHVLRVSHSRITRIIDTLVKKKLVRRFPSKRDRRSWLAEITDVGKKAHEQTVEDFQKIQAQLIKELPQDKLDVIHESLELYLKAFNEVLDRR